MRLFSPAFEHGQAIPARYAFGRADGAGGILLADNLSPPLRWQHLLPDTRSLAIACIDRDAPSEASMVNRNDREIPIDHPRAEFVHWLLVNLPAHCPGLAEGECGAGVVAGGKHPAPGPAGVVQGRNDYSAWFARDAAMAGEYQGYDGPCPPFNDLRRHHYHFVLYALDVERLPLAPGFDLAAFNEAIVDHVLAEARLVGHYSTHPGLAGS